MQSFRLTVILLFISSTLSISGCESIYEISHPREVKRQAENSRAEREYNRKQWFIDAEPQKKLSLTSLRWQPYTKSSAVKDNFKLKRSHVPSSHDKNNTGGYLLYIAEYDPTNRQTYCDTAITTDVSDVFCSGKQQIFTSKKENGIFIRSYYSDCRPDAIKKIYMTNYHCGKDSSILFGLESIASCYYDNDNMGPYPTENAKDMACLLYTSYAADE